MHGEIIVAGTDEDKMLEETLKRLHLPREADLGSDHRSR